MMAIQGINGCMAGVGMGGEATHQLGDKNKNISFEIVDAMLRFDSSLPRQLIITINRLTRPETGFLQ